MNMIQEGGIGAYAAIALGLLGLALGGLSLMAVVGTIVALLACGGAWAMSHSELPKLRYAIDENDSQSWQLADALEEVNKKPTPAACEKLDGALILFWGATDETEWPR